MDIVNILLTLLFGAIAGWLAGFFVWKDKGGLIWKIISAVIGAVILLWIWNVLKKLFKK